MFALTIPHHAMKFKLDPTKKLVVMLSLFAALVTAFNFSGSVLLHLCTTLGFSLILYWLYSTFSSKHKNIWNTVITGLIIFLVLHHGVTAPAIVAPLLATFFAITIKFFIEYRGSPIVNPAAAGILLSAAIVTVVFQDSALVSWWGASFQGKLSLVLILFWLAFGVKKWAKWQSVLGFLLANAVLLVLRGQPWSFIQYVYLDSTIYFLAAIMLIDPRTSPVRARQQWAFGLVAAVAYNILLEYGVSYAGLFSIITANLAWLMVKPRRKKR